MGRATPGADAATAAPRAADDVSVRALLPEDIEGCVEVLVRAFNELHARHGIPPLFNTFSQARATIQLALQMEADPGFVAVLGGRKVAGLAIAYRRGDYLSIGPVAVHPGMQGRGAGRLLMRSLLDRHADADTMLLTQAAYNPHAFTLYRTLGFRVAYAEAVLAGSPTREPDGGDGAAVRDAGPGDGAAIAATDRELAGVDRSGEIELWMRLGRVLVTDGGYLVTTRLGEALTIGPAAAADAAAMRRLLACALADAPPAGVRARVPVNGVGFDVLVEAGLRPEALGNLMCRGRFPARTGEHLHPMFPEVL